MTIYIHNELNQKLFKCHSPRAEAQRNPKSQKLEGWKILTIVEEISPLPLLSGETLATLQRSVSSPLMPNPPYSSAEIALGSYNIRVDLRGENITEDLYLQVRRSYEIEAKNNGWPNIILSMSQHSHRQTPSRPPNGLTQLSAAL